MTVLTYDAELALTHRIAEGRRMLHEAWAVQSFSPSELQIVEVEGLVALSRVMRITQQLFLHGSATPRRVQKRGGRGKSEGRAAAEFRSTDIRKYASDVAS